MIHPGRPAGRSLREAFTLTEIVVVVLVVSVLVSVVLTLLFRGADRTERLGAHLSAAQEARLALTRLCRELREGSRIFYPGPGGRTQPGVGFIDGTGHAVFWFVESATTGTGAGPRALKRRDLNTGATEIVAASVAAFRATVPAVAAGREPALVHLLLKTSTGATGRIEAEATQGYATSVYLRAAQSRCTEWGPVR